MISTNTHRLRQQSQALEGFLEVHGAVVSAGLVEDSVVELVEALRQDRRRLKAADRRVALRLHEAQVNRRRRLAALVAVRAQMKRARGLVTVGYGALGPRYLLSLRSEISRHAPTLNGQARRAVYALRLRAAAGVRLRVASWEVSPAVLADSLEPRQLALAAAVTEGFETSERLFAAQVERGICQKAALQRLRTVRDTVWRACHRLRQPRLAAQVRRMLARGLWKSARSLRSRCRGEDEVVRSLLRHVRQPGAYVREPRRRGKGSLQVHRASVRACFAPFALLRGFGTGRRGSRAVLRSADTGCERDIRRKLASTPAGRGRLQRTGGSAPGVRACGDFFGERRRMGRFRAGAGALRRWGRGPPGVWSGPRPVRDDVG